MQDFSANYYVERGLIVAVGLNLAILICMLHLPLKEKNPATQLKLVFSHFLRCRTAFAVIKVELAPESNKVFKVVCVLFSCFTFNSMQVIGIKVAGSMFCRLSGWIFR